MCHFPLRLVTGLMAACAALPSFAVGLSVSPPHVRLAPGQQTATVTLANQGERAVTVQASAQRWTQSADGTELETEATDFALYPKVFTVEPGKTQTVRLGRLPAAPARPESEAAYRLTLRELPVERGDSSGISITTRLRLPVWLLPKDPRSDWGLTATGTDDGMIAAAVSNRGNVHVRLVELSYAALGADGAVRGEVTAPGWYVLAGVSKAFPAKLPQGFCTGTARIRAVARTVDGEQRQEWPASAVCGRGA